MTIDRDRARSLGLPIREVTDALAVLLGSQYVNDFDFNNRAYRVYVQGDQQFRAQPSDLSQYYARASNGDMVPLSAVVRTSETTAPAVINHFNLFRSTELTGAALPGVSSGQAIQEMERIARETLPAGFDFAWSGLSLEEIKSGNQAIYLFALSILLVYLVLAAQYESWVLPFIILLGVPLAVFGALSAQLLRGFANDVFCQVGLVMLIGLAAKNSILIVEFAEQLRAQGRSIVDAAIEAARIRLRPILMTSFAFILGVLPLAFATGAGAGARNSVGTAVAGGMLASTFLSIIFIPVLYVIIRTIAPGKTRACVGCDRSRWVRQVRGRLMRRTSIRRHRALAACRMVCWRSLRQPDLSCANATPADGSHHARRGGAAGAEEQPDDRAGGAGRSCAPRRCCSRRARRRCRASARRSATCVVDTERGFDGAVTQPRSQAAFSANLARAGAGGVAMGGDHAGARSDRDRESVDGGRPHGDRRRDGAGVSRDHRAEAAGRSDASARARRRWRTSTTRSGGSRPAPARGSTSCARRRRWRPTKRGSRTRSLASGARRKRSACWSSPNGPVDAAAEPVFDVPLRSTWNPRGWRHVPTSASSPRPSAPPIASGATASRTSSPPASRRSIRRRSRRPERSTRRAAGASSCSFSQPIFDGGQRRGLRRFREAAFNTSRLALQGLQIQARSEVRLAQETVRSTERALASLRSAAQQANDVLSIVNVAFEAGATTNLEVIDAQRQARDADSAAAVGGGCGAKSAAGSADGAGEIPAVASIRL